MSNIDKQWLQQKIADMEAARDEIPFGLDEDDSNTLTALRIALASLEAEPVAWIWSNRKHPSEVTLVRPEDDEKAEAAQWSGWSCQALYLVPPEPVSQETTDREMIKRLAVILSGSNAPGEIRSLTVTARSFVERCKTLAKERDECRISIRQGYDDNSPVIPDGWVMVPVEPTKEMIDAGWSYYMTTKSPSSLGVYGAMLAAAPQQEVK